MSKKIKQTVIKQYFSCNCYPSKPDQASNRELGEPEKGNSSRGLGIGYGPNQCYIFTKNNSISPKGSNIFLNVMLDVKSSEKQLVYAEPVFDKCKGKVTMMAILAKIKKKTKYQMTTLFLDQRSNINQLGIIDAKFDQNVAPNPYKLNVELAWEGGSSEFPIKGVIPDLDARRKLEVEVTIRSIAPVFPKLCNNNLI